MEGAPLLQCQVGHAELGVSELERDRVTRATQGGFGTAGKAGAVREAWRADGGCRRESEGGALRGYLQLVGSTLSPA